MIRHHQTIFKHIIREHSLHYYNKKNVLEMYLTHRKIRKEAGWTKNVDNKTQIDTARPCILAQAAMLLSYIEQD
jgi:hypothetical protein